MAISWLDRARLTARQERTKTHRLEHTIPLYSEVTIFRGDDVGQERSLGYLVLYIGPAGAPHLVSHDGMLRVYSELSIFHDLSIAASPQFTKVALWLCASMLMRLV